MPVRLGMQIANVKHSHCEAKFGFRVWETKFGRVRRKTAPTGLGKQRLPMEAAFQFIAPHLDDDRTGVWTIEWEFRLG